MNALAATIYNIQNIANKLYIISLFDVLIIAILIYIIILLFKQTRSLLPLMGIGIIVVLYIIAQLFQLSLTASILQSFLGLLAVILVVIFQDELRRFFEFIATWSTRQVRINKISTPEPFKIVFQALAECAHNRIGALIVIPGGESVERFLEVMTRYQKLYCVIPLQPLSCV